MSESKPDIFVLGFCMNSKKRDIVISLPHNAKKHKTEKAISLLIIAVCLVAATVEIIFAYSSSSSLTAMDVGILLFVIGPYLMLMLLARWHWYQPLITRLLLAIAILLALTGITGFAWDSYRYHTEPDYQLMQRTIMFIVPFCQWLIALLVGLVLSVKWLLGSRQINKK